MAAGICENCYINIDKHLNYCSWECQIILAQKRGGKLICPNGLLITCIRYDGAMLEHEHADHKDYKFPINVEYIGVIPDDLEEWDDSFKNETHAFIYTDGSLCVSLYECCYYMWIGGVNKFDKNWRITSESVRQIDEYIKKMVSE